MTRDQLEALLCTSPHGNGRSSQYRRVNGIEDYLFIDGDRLSGREAALRLGVSRRTIERWRAALRQVTQ